MLPFLPQKHLHIFVLKKVSRILCQTLSNQYYIWHILKFHSTKKCDFINGDIANINYIKIILFRLWKHGIMSHQLGARLTTDCDTRTACFVSWQGDFITITDGKICTFIKKEEGTRWSVWKLVYFHLGTHNYVCAIHGEKVRKLIQFSLTLTKLQTSLRIWDLHIINVLIFPKSGLKILGLFDHRCRYWSGWC